MSFSLKRILTILPLLTVAGCGHVPFTSLLKLSSIDFATTEIAAIRAGIALPETLVPMPDSVKLTFLAETDDGMTVRRSFTLEEDLAAQASGELEAEPNVRVYRLKEREVGELAVARAEVLARGKSGNGGRLEISVGAEACRTGPLPQGSLPMSTYLKTSETKSFVALTRDVDLRALGGNPDLGDSIPPCF
jgi:hypothetical protein